ncbi:TetR family transcriptional regulator [Nocardia sp. NPDC055049]
MTETSTNRIAVAAGVSIGTVYRYFSDRSRCRAGASADHGRAVLPQRPAEIEPRLRVIKMPVICSSMSGGGVGEVAHGAAGRDPHAPVAGAEVAGRGQRSVESIQVGRHVRREGQGPRPARGGAGGDRAVVGVVAIDLAAVEIGRGVTEVEPGDDIQLARRHESSGAISENFSCHLRTSHPWGRAFHGPRSHHPQSTGK